MRRLEEPKFTADSRNRENLSTLGGIRTLGTGYPVREICNAASVVARWVLDETPWDSEDPSARRLKTSPLGNPRFSLS
jgi:hypothetical protein